MRLKDSTTELLILKDSLTPIPLYMNNIPKQLLGNKYRKDMWRNVLKMIKKIARNLPIKEIELVGSFSTKKRRPADVDFSVFLKTPKNSKEKWSVDMVIAPDNAHGKYISEDVHKWMAQKYGKKNYISFKLK